MIDYYTYNYMIKQTNLDNLGQSNLHPEHFEEFKTSAITPDIIAANFRSFDGDDENDRDEAFLLIKEYPQHNNNGTLSGASQNNLANALYAGCWAFQGYRGGCVKLNNPRKDAEGKPIKYESLRDVRIQLFIPHVTVRVAIEIDENTRHLVAKSKQIDEYIPPSNLSLDEIDKDFWDWFATTNYPLLITEGAKKACSIISNGFPSVGLNGIWGWGNNAKNENGEVIKDSKGYPVKSIHSDLLPFLNGREIIFALDCDENRTDEDVEKVNKAAEAANKSKKSFYWTINGTEGKEKYSKTKFTEIKWEEFKGIDDYLNAQSLNKREVALTKLVSNKSKAEGKPKSQSTEAAKKESKEDKEKYVTPLDLAKVATYFHTADKVAYADISIEGNRHTYSIRSRAFKLWLTGEHYRENKTGISSQSFQDTLSTLEAIAIFDGESREVNLRVAEHQGKLYLDLGTPDWKAVEIDSSGWRVISEPPIRFSRPDSLLPLPYPVEGGSLDELKGLLNVDGSSWTLIVTFLLFCFCPNKTYPVLVLAAHRGSGKTAAAEILKGLIDPGKAGLIKLQGDTHKLAIAASRRHLMVYDNVGNITPDQSDDLCRVATGFGYSTRTLHTTDEETTFEFTRPQIITAIDALVTRDDLADRVLMAQLPEIPEQKRLPQGKLNEKVESAKPRILGALLTALSQTLAELPNTNPDNLPRMADYAQFAIASEKALGLESGEFTAIFNESREHSRQVVIESSPVGEAIVRLMENTALVWRGTASQLINELEKHTDEATYRSRFFPKASNMLSRQLNRLAPDLKALGIEITSIREGAESKKIICIEKRLMISRSQDATSNDSKKRVATDEEF
jgi:energy-coupling factor transporter ATP-binding protein EcfA2